MRSVVFECDPLDLSDAAKIAREMRMIHGAAAESYCQAALQDPACGGPKRREMRRVLRALGRLGGSLA